MQTPEMVLGQKQIGSSLSKKKGEMKRLLLDYGIPSPLFTLHATGSHFDQHYLANVNLDSKAGKEISILHFRNILLIVWLPAQFPIFFSSYSEFNFKTHFEWIVARK